jgi:hypothetical protein
MGAWRSTVRRAQRSMAYLRSLSLSREGHIVKAIDAPKQFGPRLSRRGLLKTAAATAIALPWVVPSSVLGHFAPGHAQPSDAGPLALVAAARQRRAGHTLN